MKTSVKEAKQLLDKAEKIMKTKKTKVYKVVKSQDFGKTFSSTSVNGLSLYYEIGKTTYPKIGKIFVFATFKDALNLFNTSCKDYYVFEGTATNVTKPKLMSNFWSSLEDFWKRREQKKKLLETYTIPEGTLFADSFTPERFMDLTNV
jgi:hypothetical protein